MTRCVFMLFRRYVLEPLVRVFINGDCGWRAWIDALRAPVERNSWLNDIPITLSVPSPRRSSISYPSMTHLIATPSPNTRTFFAKDKYYLCFPIYIFRFHSVVLHRQQRVSLNLIMLHYYFFSFGIICYIVHSFDCFDHCLPVVLHQSGSV